MAIINIVKRAPKIIKKGVDKIFKREIKGAEGSPFKNVDDLGFFPVARDVKDLPGTEIKKVKAAGEKISKEFKKKDLAQKRELRTDKAMGGRIMGYQSGGKVCKLAVKGKGRAYGKNS
jgi:hypothetical protein